MDDDATQPSTQQVLDPRRLGRNNSGLSEADISDVLCILHPCSVAAIRIVAQTALERPQHVLQNTGLVNFQQEETDISTLEEQETFILESPDFKHAQDLALRFSSRTIDPVLGFCFGRNPLICDIYVDVDTVRRVSNRHFRIFLNNYGILMLEDTSTNGTLVDDTLLKGKGAQAPATRTLQPGSIIQILSPKPDEVIKFVLRIPTRDGHEEQYMRRFQTYRAQVAAANQRNLQNMGEDDANQLAAAEIGVEGMPFLGEVRPPMSTPNFGMHWNGGEKYNVIGQLGKGAFATVYQLATTLHGQPLAAKELEKKRFIKNGRLDQRIDNEMQIMKGLRHPNIVEYVDYVDRGNYLYIIMEYVPCGDLQGYLNENGPLPESSARVMACQILHAMAYLHKKRITHRDIKPDNVLIACSDPFTVKLSDFGLSKVVKNNETFLKTFCGTLLYCAPEVFPHYDAHAAGKRPKRGRSSQNPQKDFHSYSQSVDIWSFAAVLWFSLCKQPPFEGIVDQTGKAMFNKIMGTSLDVTPLARRGISDEAIDLLRAMLNTDPSSRPTELDCLRHPWLADISGVPDKLSDIDLNAIAEEEDEDDDRECEEANDELSQLSINDREPDREDSEFAEVDIGVEDFEFLDNRQSKRLKIDGRNVHLHQKPDSDIERDSQPISVFHEIKQNSSSPQQSSRPNRLFGEIGQSALQSSRILGAETKAALSLLPGSLTDFSSADTHFYSRTQSEFGSDPPSVLGSEEGNFGQLHQSESKDVNSDNAVAGAQAAASLLGAESLVRELNMTSPPSAHSAAATPNEPSTPPDTETSQPRTFDAGDGTDDQQVRPEDDTPKRPSFDRQIRLPLPTSLYYDLESSSENSSFQGAPSRGSKRDGSVDAHGLNYQILRLTDAVIPANIANPASSDTITNMQIKSSSPPEFLRPFPRLGKLTSTRDSFVSIVLKLERRTTTWGRNPNSTIVYPDEHDTRVARNAMSIGFFAKGIDDLDKAGDDWTKLDDLHTNITTASRLGIWVNDVHLKPVGSDGRFWYGKLYTGDIIKVTQPGRESLKFECEFYFGEAAKRRPPGKEFKELHLEMPQPTKA